MGCRFQANLGSFAGFYSGKVRDLAKRLDAQEAYRYNGTDGHTSEQLRKNPRPGR